ncbi:MAG: hypothetical protein N3G21_08685, partial [Candidatus Hydrogenedentes bacterium]|nr:hypothetical protein [Candidatus Hydrogenedentota bacterium]
IINPNQLIKFSKALHIKIDSTTSVETIENLLNLIVKNLGKCGVYFHYVDNNCEREFVVQAHPDYKVTPSPTLIKEVENLLGKDTAWFSPGYELARIINKNQHIAASTNADIE